MSPITSTDRCNETRQAEHECHAEFGLAVGRGFRRSFSTGATQLQIVLDRNLDFYNHPRAHQGYRTRGRTPAEIFFMHRTRHHRQPKEPWNVYTNAVPDSLVDTVTPPMLMQMVAPGMLQPKLLTAHRFTLDQVRQA